MALGGSYTQPRGGKNFGGAWWDDTWKAPKDRPVVIRLVRGDYALRDLETDGTVVQKKRDFKRFVVHRIGGRQGKEFICSGGDFVNTRNARYEHLGTPCHGCTEADASYAARRGSANRDNADNQWANSLAKYGFTLWEFSKYIRQPKIIQGRPKLDRNNKPILEWVRESYPPVPSAYIQETCDGILLPAVFSNKGLASLDEKDNEIGRTCAVCGTPNSIVVRRLRCPKCLNVLHNDTNKNVVYDLDCVPPENHDNAVAFFEYNRTKPHTCDSCGTADVTPIDDTNDDRMCTRCGNSGRRATIFDVDLTVQHMGTGNESRVVVVSYSQVCQPNVDPAKFQQLDLEAKFKPASLLDQMSIIEERRKYQSKPEGTTVQVPGAVSQYQQWAPPPPPTAGAQAPQPGFQPPPYTPPGGVPQMTQPYPGALPAQYSQPQQQYPQPQPQYAPTPQYPQAQPQPQYAQQQVPAQQYPQYPQQAYAPPPAYAPQPTQGQYPQAPYPVQYPNGQNR